MRFSFADCVLDTGNRRLARAGEDVAVEPQVFDLLQLLVENAGKLVTKDEIVDVVWGGRIVSEATISARINAARSAVGDSGKAQAVIRTVPRRGLEFVAEVQVEGAAAAKPASAPLRQKIRYTASADGTQIAWSSAGEGPPVLRMSHYLSHLELDWSNTILRPTIDRLSDRRTLIRYDVRGAGLSDDASRGSQIEAHVADLAAVVAAAGLEGFPLVTTLQSAPVGLRYVAENPGTVSKLIVHEGYVKGRALRPGAPADQDADPLVALMKSGWGEPHDGSMRGWVSMAVPTATPEEVTEIIETFGAAVPADKVVAARKNLDLFTAEGFLERIKVPTLIIHPRRGTLHPLSEAQELARGIEGAELMVVDSANSVSVPSDPTHWEQLDAIAEFLDRP